MKLKQAQKFLEEYTDVRVVDMGDHLEFEAFPFHTQDGGMVSIGLDLYQSDDEIEIRQFYRYWHPDKRDGKWHEQPVGYCDQIDDMLRWLDDYGYEVGSIHAIITKGK